MLPLNRRVINVSRMSETNTTDFGFERVPPGEKTQRVSSVFSHVASRYDLMNDLMSLGIHHLWKRVAVQLAGVQKGDRVLDVAGGTGDMTRLYHARTDEQGEVIMTDINADMLAIGRDRCLDKNILNGVNYVQANAEYLPFPKNYFDCVNISFGLRNITDKPKALKSMCHVTKYGGSLVILEFSKVVIPLLEKLYKQYSFNIIPLLGKYIAHDEKSYRYLVESIQMHPDQETLKEMIKQAGYAHVEYHNLSGGIVAIHRARKI